VEFDLWSGWRGHACVANYDSTLKALTGIFFFLFKSNMKNLLLATDFMPGSLSLNTHS
jgi:hypothetical protein